MTPVRKPHQQSAATPSRIVPISQDMSVPSVRPRLLGIPEAAVYISGTNWFVEELIRNNEIRAIVIGKGRKIDIRDLDVWIESEKERQALNPPEPIGFARTRQQIGKAA